MNRTIDRRKAMGLMGVAAAASLPAQGAVAPPTQLHVDLVVTPGHEDRIRQTFDKIFRPTIRKQPGFVDVKLMKFRVARAGNTPPAGAYRLLISFETEEQRQTWVATADHQRVWPEMEKHLKMVNALVYDPVV